jgi:hypothetical protein
LVDRQDRLAGADCLAHLGDNHGDDTVARRAQDGFLQPSLNDGTGRSA